MLLIIACLLTTGIIGFTTLVAGRIAGVSLTVLTSGLMAFFMPPVFSFRVARSTDIAALVVQSVVGMIVAQTTRRRTRRRQQVDLPPTESLPLRRRRLESSRLADVVPRLLEKDSKLRLRSADLQVQVDQFQHFTLSESELGRIVTDILRLAFARTDVRRVSIYAARQPSWERISVVAEYDLEPALPRLRILGRNDDQCKLVPTSNWPRECSATWFDNGFEYIYQVAIRKPEGCASSSLAVERGDEVPVTHTALVN